MRRPVLAAALLVGAVAEPLRAQRIPLGLELYMPVPEQNPLTPDKVELGRRLFFDPSLSADGRVSCASCHNPGLAFADSVPLSRGVHGRTTLRNSPSLLNAGWGRSFFWDGRTASLEEQVVRPIEDPREMGRPVSEVAAHTGLTSVMLAEALASYVRTLRSGDSPADRFAAGVTDALTAEQRAGFEIFIGKGNCATCHSGPLFTDHRFHNTGVAWVRGALADSGRYTVTRRDTHLGAFKTPTLREITRTAPYMHDGSLASLEDVIEFYDRGGNSNRFLDRGLRPLRLTSEEKSALLAFLRALSGKVSEGWP